MTEQVAIKRLQDHFEIHDDGRPHPFLDKAVSMAIEALKERALYKEGKLCLVPADIYEKLCKELDELKEKQTAKKPIDKSKNPTDWHVMACPNCEHIFWNSGQFVRYQPNFCNYCGQKLDWTD